MLTNLHKYSCYKSFERFPFIYVLHAKKSEENKLKINMIVEKKKIKKFCLQNLEKIFVRNLLQKSSLIPNCDLISSGSLTFHRVFVLY